MEIAQEEEQGHPWIALSIQDQGVGIPGADLPPSLNLFIEQAMWQDAFQGQVLG